MDAKAMTEKMGTILWTRDINPLTGLSKLSIPPDAIEMKSNSMLIAVSVHSMVVSPISRRTRFTMRTMYPRIASDSSLWIVRMIELYGLPVLNSQKPNSNLSIKRDAITMIRESISIITSYDKEWTMKR
jgi:hypothetical protein